jgi:hypothetical protein
MMKKYHIAFTNRTGRAIIEYDTDVEPPVAGDIVRLSDITHGKITDLFIVYDRRFEPINENQVDVEITLDLYDNEPFA